MPTAHPVWNPKFTHNNWSKSKKDEEKKKIQIPDTGMGKALDDAKKAFDAIQWNAFETLLGSNADPTKITSELSNRYNAGLGKVNTCLNQIIALLTGPKLRGLAIAKQFLTMAEDTHAQLSLTKGLYFKAIIADINAEYKKLLDAAQKYGKAYREAGDRVWAAFDEEEKLGTLLETIDKKGMGSFQPSMLDDIEKRAAASAKIIDDNFPSIRTTELEDEYFTGPTKQLQCAKDMRAKERGKYGDLSAKNVLASKHENWKKNIPLLLKKIRGKKAGLGGS